MTTPNPLPDPSRYITATSPSGKSHFTPLLPATVPPTRYLGPSTPQRLLYTLPAPPYDFSPIPSSSSSSTSTTASDDITSFTALLARGPNAIPRLEPPDGSTAVYTVDTPPGGGSPMHRTLSCDVIVVTAGRIELSLDGGETKLLQTGDVVVQRATMHRWRNPSGTEWARIVVLMTRTEPVRVEGGKELGQEFLAE